MAIIKVDYGDVVGGGNAQYERTSQAMNNTWTEVSINCDANDLLLVVIYDTSNRTSVLYANGDGTFSTINSTSYTNVKVENNKLYFMYTWTGSGVSHNVDYCYSV